MAADVPHRSFGAYADETVPQAAVGAAGKSGRLELSFAADADGRTCLVRDYARTPFHVSGTLGHDPLDRASTVCVQSPTGGVAQGDRHESHVRVGPDAVARVGTASATKVHSMNRNYAATTTALTVESGGHLDYVPDPTILHADARLCRDARLDVARDASAVVGDVVVSGRLARGERFEFERYYARLTGRGPDGRLFEDASHLHPADDDPTAPGVLGDFAVYGTLYAVAPSADESALSDRLHDRVADGPGRAAATTLPNGAGVVVRALGDRSETVSTALHGAWDAARRELLDAPAPDWGRP
ncbi:urease accessory protein UreD [Haloarculaceae archaeon H-GB2-1]|nr:urease accessory protein UreD [Haloarculaceae archaeon H-GB2-1]